VSIRSLMTLALNSRLRAISTCIACRKAKKDNAVITKHRAEKAAARDTPEAARSARSPVDSDGSE